MTKNSQRAVHCVGRQTVTIVRPTKTPFQANGGVGGVRLFTRHRHLPSVNKRENLLPKALGLTITPAAHNRISPPAPRLDRERMYPRASCVSFNPESLNIYALCNLTHAYGALPPSVAVLQGRVEPCSQLTAQRNAAQARCSQRMSLS